ncbi:hypothetical protein T492DRAFT_1015600 [Pavlovales sp. CCMP2436]|nr:hypothetical protein T492DRAFT_1015600 [Pavlovales sp. CCMP2436]
MSRADSPAGILAWLGVTMASDRWLIVWCQEYPTIRASAPSSSPENCRQKPSLPCREGCISSTITPVKTGAMNIDHPAMYPNWIQISVSLEKSKAWLAM